MKSYYYRIRMSEWEGSDEEKWSNSRFNVIWNSPLNQRYIIGKINGKYIIIQHSLYQSDWNDNGYIYVHVLSKYNALRMMGKHIINIAKNRSLSD